ncbi:uncharacterized protein [Argopecten irradians]
MYGDALIVASDELCLFLEKFLRWRPASKAKNFFLASSGRSMTSSTICQDLERMFRLVCWRKPVSATSLRQFSATVVKSHKTSSMYGDALIVASDELCLFLEKFLRWRPAIKAKNFFLASSGRSMTSSTICQDLERMFRLVCWRKPVSATSLRQFSATVVKYLSSWLFPHEF